MPQRPNKPCRHRGCNTLSRSPSGFCDAHQSEASGWNHPRRESAKGRGYDYAWQKIRDWVMQRDTGLCQPCLKLGAVSAAQEVDHIVPKAQAKRLGWTREQMDARENLQAICKACHAVKTARESRGLFTSLLA